MATPVVFVHGAWFTPACWDNFRSRFTACGFECHAPPWPFVVSGSTSGCYEITPGFEALEVGRIVDHYEAIVRRLPAAPIVVGHSVGGLLVQMLLDRGLGAAGIALCPFAPKGVPLRLTALRWLLPPVKGTNGLRYMSRSRFDHDFGHQLTRAERTVAFREQILPVPRRVLFQAALGIGTRVRFGNDARAPLLLVSAGKDSVVPATTVYCNYRRHLVSAARTAYKSFDGRSHWLVAGHGWEDVADHAIEWLTNQSI